jgi:hypothetical protein
MYAKLVVSIIANEKTLEILPEHYPVTIQFDDNSEQMVSLTGPELVKLLRHHKMIIPEHFKQFIPKATSINFDEERHWNTYPCTYANVKLVFTDGSEENYPDVTGVDVIRLCKKHNISIPKHFEKYISNAYEITFNEHCLESNPCTHENVVVYFGDGRAKRYDYLGANTIIELYKKHKLEVPNHFDYVIQKS